MEGIALIKNLLQTGDFLCSIDLKDAYFTIPIHTDHRKYLCFQWQGLIYQFVCLPFGLSSAPRTFTKVLKPLATQLRQQGIRCSFYLDDILITGKTSDECQKHVNKSLKLLQDLGFLINWEKSSLTPSQNIEYLGFNIDTNSMTLSLPCQKVDKITQSCLSILQEPSVTVRDLASLIGKMSATISAVLPAPLFYRHLQQDKITALRLEESYETKLMLSAGAREELQSWVTCLRKWNGKAILTTAPDILLQTDASLQGWGACAGHLHTGGHWNREESTCHINYLELLAAFFGVQSLIHEKEVHVRL